MRDEVGQQDVELPLPTNWHSCVRHAVLNIIGIVRIAMLVGRESLMKNGDVHAARIHQLESEVAMLREELRVNGPADHPYSTGGVSDETLRHAAPPVCADRRIGASPVHPPEDRVAICPAQDVIAATTSFRFACTGIMGIHAEGRWTRSPSSW